MPDDFKVTLQAELDTTKAEQQIKDLGKDNKVKITVDAGDSAKGVQNVNQSIKTTRSTATSFGDALKRALNIGSSAAVVAKGFQLIHTAARNARAAIKDIDAAITDLRLATGDNYASAAKMVTEYNGMGKALGATTKEVNDSAVTWRRQGKSAKDTGVLIKDTMILSKVGMLDSAEAAKYLTSSMKGYGVSVDDAIRVIDKLTAVDANAAVNAGGLAQAMSQTAVTANMAGVSMDKLLGYLAVVGETTQKDMSSIGNSFKTIFARMNDIKAGKLSLVDEDGTTELLSDVEITLKNVGIDLRATMSEFNNSGEVLDALAAKWDNLSSVQQAALTKAFAGVRQGENFRVLMENYDAASKYMNIAANSAGTAEKKFSAYLDSIEAKTKSLQAAFESLAVNSVSTETFGGIVDATTALVEFADKTNLVKGAMAGLATAGAIKGFTALATGITSATARFQEFNGALQLLKAGNIGEAQISQLATLTANLSASQLKAVLSSKALSVEQRISILTAQGMGAAEAKAALETMGLATAEGAATGATVGFSGALKGLWATIAANPITAIALAVTAGVTLYGTYKRKAEEARKAALDAAKETARAAAEQANKIGDLYKAYQTANSAYKEDSSNKDALIEATNNLLAVLGEEGRKVRDLGKDYGDLGNEIAAVIKQKRLESLLDLSNAVTAKREDIATKYGANGEKLKGTYGVSFNSTDDVDRRIAEIISQSIDGAEIEIAYEQTGFTRQDTGSRTVHFLSGGAEKRYAQLLEAQDAITKMASEGWFSADELKGSNIYQFIRGQIEELKPEVEELNELIGQTNALAIEYQFSEYTSAHNLPKTLAEFKEFREGLLGASFSSGLFEGDSKAIESAVDTYLQAFSGFDRFYGLSRFEEEIKALPKDVLKYLKGTGEWTDKVQSAYNDFLDDTKYTSEQFNSYYKQIADSIDDDGNIISESVKGRIGDLTSLKDELIDSTSALEKYKAALEGGEKGDAAEEMAKAYKAAIEDLDAGENDTRAVQAAAELFLSKDWLASNNYDLKAAGEALRSGIWEAAFSDEGDYGKNFANYIKNNLSDIADGIVDIQDLGDGKFTFAYSSLSELSDAFDMSEAACTALLDSLDKFGVQVMMSGEEMDKLVQELNLSKDAAAASESAITSIVESLAAGGNNAWEISAILDSLQSAGYVDLSNISNLGEIIQSAAGGLDDLDQKDPNVEVTTTVEDSELTNLESRLAELSKGITVHVGISADDVGSVGGNAINGASRHRRARAAGGIVANPEDTMLNELGPEAVIRNGEAYIAGNGEPTTEHLQRGDIVLPADVTEKAFNNHASKKKLYSAARGLGPIKDIVIFDGGGTSSGVKPKKRPKPPVAEIDTGSSIVGSSSGSSVSGGSSSDSDKKQKIDWIEVAIDRIKRGISSLGIVADSTFKKTGNRLSASKEEIKEITKEIELQQKAYERYMQEAKSVGLSEDIAKLVRDGTIDINEYDEDTAKLISQYEEWYTAAIDCRDVIDELHESVAKLYQEQFDNVKGDYENQLNVVTQRMELVDDDIALIQAKGYMETTKQYAELAELQKSNIDTMRKELSDLQSALSKAVSSGEIEMYSDAYYEMQAAIGGVKKSIAEATVKLQEYENTMRELEWSYFDFAQDRFSQLPKEADFLIRLMSNDPLFDNDGKANDEGMATIGLHALNYNAYMAQADEYAKEAQKIQNDLAKDPLNTDLIKRREQLLDLQQQSILAAEDEKTAVKDLVEQGINLELDSLKNLIDAYKDSLDSAKDLYDYQKKINSKTSDIASIQKQLAAYANDTSEENRARVQKLQTQLEKAQDDLQETEYQQYIKDQKTLLDGLYSDYETTLNARLDDVNVLMSDMIAATNDNTSEISRAIREASDTVGYRVSDSLNAIFASDSWSVLSDYESFSQTTPINQIISGIYALISTMLGQSGGVKAFASGGLADFTGLAKLDGTPGKPELVLNPNETKDFLALRDTLKGVDLTALKSTPYLSALDSNESRYRDLIRNVTNKNTDVDSNVTIGDINFNVQADSYEDIIRQAQKDPKFEKLIQAMTIDRLTGKGSLYKYQKVSF